MSNADYSSKEKLELTNVDEIARAFFQRHQDPVPSQPASLTEKPSEQPTAVEADTDRILSQVVNSFSSISLASPKNEKQSEGEDECHICPIICICPIQSPAALFNRQSLSTRKNNSPSTSSDMNGSPYNALKNGNFSDEVLKGNTENQNQQTNRYGEPPQSHELTRKTHRQSQSQTQYGEAPLIYSSSPKNRDAPLIHSSKGRATPTPLIYSSKDRSKSSSASSSDGNGNTDCNNTTSECTTHFNDGNSQLSCIASARDGEVVWFNKKDQRRGPAWYGNNDLPFDKPPIIRDTMGNFLTLFFTTRYCFSNHFKCESLTIDGKRFLCTEQYYMYYKAVVFDDVDIMHAIMNETDPKTMKRMGEEVRGFDQRKWFSVSIKVMAIAQLHKYAQDPLLREQLFETDETELVEASPTDIRWGVKLAIDDDRIADKRQWGGLNLMGLILTELRERLKQNPAFKWEYDAIKNLRRNNPSNHIPL